MAGSKIPDNSIKTVFFADSAQAEAAIVKLEKKVNDLTNTLKHMHKEGKHGAHGMGAEFAHVGMELFGMVAGFTTVIGLTEKCFEAAKEWRKEVDSAATSLDKAGREFAIRSGTFGPQGKETLEEIRKAGSSGGLSHADSEALYGDLKRRGFDQEGIKDNFADAAAAYKIAKISTGVDTQQFADAAAKTMDTQKDKGGAELVKATQDVANLTRGKSAMTPADVSSLAVTLESLRGGKGEQRHLIALAKMKIKPEQVDMIGESFTDAVATMAKGLHTNVPKDKQMGVLKSLVGDAEQARRVMTAVKALGENEGNYGQAVEAATGGADVAKIRQAGELHEIHAAQGSEHWQALTTQAEITAQKQGAGWGASGRKLWADTLNITGNNEEYALKSAYGQAGKEVTGHVPEEWLTELKKQTALAEAGLAEHKKANEKHDEANGHLERNKGKPARGNGKE